MSSTVAAPSATELWTHVGALEKQLGTYQWPVFEGNVDAMWSRTGINSARDLGPFLIEAAEELISDELARGLIWTGFKARRVLHEGTFGERRSTWAVSTNDVRAKTPPFPTVFSYSPSNSPFNNPAAAAFREDAFSRGEGALKHHYELNSSVPNLDQVTASIFIFRSREFEKMMSRGRDE